MMINIMGYLLNILRVLLGVFLFSVPSPCVKTNASSFVSTNGANSGAQKSAQICETINEQTSEIWNIAIPKIRGLPTICGDILVVSADHGVIAVSRKNGDILWSIGTLNLDINSNITHNKAVRFQMFSPVLASNTLLIAMSEEDTGHIFGVDLYTGVLKWSYESTNKSPLEESRGRILSRPIIRGNSAIFRTGRGLTALRASDGKEVWNKLFDPNGMVPIVLSGPPAFDSRAIYFNSDFGVAYAIDPTDGHIIWSRQTQGLDIQRTANVRKMSITFTACHPLRVHEKLIVTDGVGNIYAKRASDGGALWQIKTGLAFQLSSIRERIYAGTENGFLEIDEKTGKILREHQVANGVIGFAIRGDIAYLGTIPSGWEAFSLSRWKTQKNFDDFHVSTMTIHLNQLYLSGYTGQSRESGELRAYSLDARH